MRRYGATSTDPINVPSKEKTRPTGLYLAGRAARSFISMISETVYCSGVIACNLREKLLFAFRSDTGARLVVSWFAFCEVGNGSRYATSAAEALPSVVIIMLTACRITACRVGVLNKELYCAALHGLPPGWVVDTVDSGASNGSFSMGLSCSRHWIMSRKTICPK